MANALKDVAPLECATFDTRVHNRHITQGRITVADIEKDLKGLPDDADNAETVTVYLGADPPSEEEEAEVEGDETPVEGAEAEATE